MSDADTLLEAVESMQNLLVSYATGGAKQESQFKGLRETLIESRVSDKLPRFVRACRDLSQFWAFIKKQSDSWQGRREFLWEAFRPALEYLEGQRSTPAEDSVRVTLARLDAGHVHQLWEKALSRRNDDPEGAITAARTLFESVCKCILDDVNVPYDQHAELPQLYRLTADNLHLSPDLQNAQVFKQVFGGCQTIVGGLAAIRNKFSDSHGTGKERVRPSPWHAELAVNLAGTMAIFLIACWESTTAERRALEGLDGS